MVQNCKKNKKNLGLIHNQDFLYRFRLDSFHQCLNNQNTTLRKFRFEKSAFLALLEY